MKKRTLIILFTATILLVVAIILTSCEETPQIEAAEPTEEYPVTRVYRFPYNNDVIYYVIYKDNYGIYHELDRFDTNYSYYQIEVGSKKSTIRFYGNSEIRLSLTEYDYINMPFVGN